MRRSIYLRILLFAAFSLAAVALRSDTECPGCDCSHFPISDPNCVKCCFVQKGTVVSASSTSVTLTPISGTDKHRVEAFKIQKSTKINGQVKEGALATVYFHRAEDENIATQIDGLGFSHGSLVPANLPGPPDICVESWEKLRMHGINLPPIPADAMRIFFGTSEAYSIAQRVIVWKIGSDDILILQRTETGMLVSAKIRGSDGQLIAQIVDNEFFINPHNSFQLKAGTSSLTVYSSKGERILGIEFVNPHVITILGTFFGPNGEKITISEDQAVFTSQSPRGGAVDTFKGNCFGGDQRGFIEITANGTIRIAR
jgi:hypothetical protein